MKRFDKAYWGILFGALLPVAGFFAGYKFVYYRYGVKGLWKILTNPHPMQSDTQTTVFTFCMLPSLFLFYLVFFQWKLEQASKGLVMVSLIYAAVFCYLKFM